MTLKNLFHNHYIGECPVDDTILGTNGFYIIFMYIHCVNKIISLDSEYMGLLWYVYSFSTNRNKNNLCRSFRGNSRKHISIYMYIVYVYYVQVSDVTQWTCLFVLSDFGDYVFVCLSVIYL